MKESENDENAATIKALVYKASAFTKNGHPISIDKIEEIHSFTIEKGEFYNEKYKFTSIATISIDKLSLLYEMEGYANEKEIIGSINIKQTHQHEVFNLFVHIICSDMEQ